MFSKQMLRTVVQELSTPTLVVMGKEAIAKVGNEEISSDQLEHVEMIVGEMRRRTPQTSQDSSQPRRRTSRTDNTQESSKPVQTLTEGEEQP